MLKSYSDEEPHEYTDKTQKWIPIIMYWIVDHIFRVPWEQGVKFDAIASSFADLIHTKYGRVSVVFDG